MIVSCVSTKPTSSGFLKNKTELTKDKKDHRYRRPEFNVSLYDNVYIEPISLQLTTNKLNAEQLIEVSQYFHDSLKSAFDPHFKITEKPTKKTLVVRSAITAVDSVNVPINTVLSFVAIPIDNGGASVEIELIDGFRLKNVSMPNHDR